MSSTRLSAASKEMIRSAYSETLIKLQNQRDEILKNEINIVRKEIREDRDFKILQEAGKNLLDKITEKYPGIRIYSCLRDLSNLENSELVYSSYEYEDEVKKSEKYQELNRQIKEVEKERNMLLFRLENAPIKSDDYKEAYFKLQEIMSNG